MAAGALAGKAAAITDLAARVAQRDGPPIQQRVALTDGAQALQDEVRARLRAGNRRRGICGPAEFKGVHRDRSALKLRVFADLLNRSHDIGIGAAAADVTAHQFLHRRVIGTARFLEQRHGRHDLA